MNENEQKQNEHELRAFLAEAFNKHGVECYIDNELELIILPHQYMTAWANLYNRSSTATLVMQLDIHLEIGLGKTIVESCVGIGLDMETAISDAKANFLKGPFHALLSAFLTTEYDDQVNKEKWTINNYTYDVTMSHLSTRGTLPDPMPMQWLEQFEELIKNQPITPETHWIRLYYAQSERELISGEVLFDNDIWLDVEKNVRQFKFPTGKDFFSIRLFLVLKDKLDVSRAAAKMAWLTDKSNEEIEQLFIQDGISPSDAEKLIDYIPLAFGRVFLKGMTKASFPDEATIMTGKDYKEEYTINLNDERIYTEAYRLAENIVKNGCVRKELFSNIFIQSAEFNAFNNALNGGAKIEDMNDAKFGSPIIHFNHFTPQTINNKSEKKEEALENRNEQETKKPFWKFWKK